MAEGVRSRMKLGRGGAAVGGSAIERGSVNVLCSVLRLNSLPRGVGGCSGDGAGEIGGHARIRGVPVLDAKTPMAMS